MRKPSPWIVVAIAALSIACGSTGSSTSSGGDGGSPGAGKDAKKLATVPVGQTITLDSSLLGAQTAAEITIKSAKAAPQGDTEFDKPQNGQYLILDVLAVGKTGTYHANPFNFKFVAADGTVSEATFASVKPLLNATDLQAGQKVEGNVIFDLKQGAEKGGKVALKDPLGSADVGYWTV